VLGTFHHRVQTGSGAHPAYLMGTRGSFLGINQPGREADHSLSSKNVWSYTSTTPIHLHNVVLS